MKNKTLSITKAQINAGVIVAQFKVIASEYADFHENGYKIVKKSVYQRKYYLQNVINDICSKYKNKLQISVCDLTKIENDYFQRKRHDTSTN